MEQAPLENMAKKSISPAESPQKNQVIREDEIEEQVSFESGTEHEFDHSTSSYDAPELEAISPSAHSSMMEKRTHESTSLHPDSLVSVPKYASMLQFTEEFWKEKKKKMLEVSEAEMMGKSKNMSVPMARVKKIMRIDDDVRSLMISSDAPLFMAQACEFFIEEMTGMGWQYVSESRRRILQKADIAAAVQKNDQFDFLIDFLPPRARDSNHSVKQVLTAPETFHTPTFLPSLAAFNQKNAAIRVSAQSELPERTPRPYRLPCEEKKREERKVSKWTLMHEQMETEKKKRKMQEAPTDPASITLGSQQPAGTSEAACSQIHDSSEESHE